MTDQGLFLVDTSVWIDHYRHGNARLADLLRTQRVLTHSVVLGELFLGSGIPRHLRARMRDLPRIPASPPEQVLRFISEDRLERQGLGWADACILYDALRQGYLLWTDEKRLQAAARRLTIHGP